MGLVAEWLKAQGITKEHPDYAKWRHKGRMLLVPGHRENEAKRKRKGYEPEKRREYRRSRRQYELQRARERRGRRIEEARAKESARAKKRYQAKREQVLAKRREWYHRNAEAERVKNAARKDRRIPTRSIAAAQRELESGAISLREFVDRVGDTLAQIDERLGKRKPGHRDTTL